MGAKEKRAQLDEILTHAVDPALVALGARRNKLAITKALSRGRIELNLRATVSQHGTPIVDGMAYVFIDGWAKAKALLGARGDDANDLLLACPMFLCFEGAEDIWEPRKKADWAALARDWGTGIPGAISRLEALSDMRTFVAALEKDDRVAREARSSSYGVASLLIAYAVVGRLADGIRAVGAFPPFSTLKGARQKQAQRALAAISKAGPGFAEKLRKAASA